MTVQEVAQGGVVTLTAIYEDGAGTPTDPPDPLIDILDADGTMLVEDAVPTRDSLGHFSYDYTVPGDGVLGRWEGHFTGTISGYLVGANDEFEVVAPGAIITSTYDLLTLAEGKAALNITGSQFDDEVASYITAVSQRLDDLCGPIVKRSISDEQHDGGGSTIWPDRSPVATIGTVTEYASGAATVLAAESVTVAGDYVLLGAGGHNSRLSRRSSWSDQYFSSGTVVISYVAGRFASTASVSAKFKQAAARMLTFLWKTDQGAGTATFGGVDEFPASGLGFAIPNFVSEMLADEVRPPVIA